MTAIRIIDSHLELADIGTNTHAQIDTHIAAADNYVKRDGSLALTSDWDIGDTRKILADEIRARDGDGLKLYDDGGNGMFVEDGGNVGIGTDSPQVKLQVNQSVDDLGVKIVGFDDQSGEYLHSYIDSNGVATIACDGNIHIRSQITSATNTGRLLMMRSGIQGTQVGFRWMDFNTILFGLDSSTDKTMQFYNTNISKVLKVEMEDDLYVHGDVGIDTTTPTAKLDINSDIFRLRTAKTPATAGAAGNQGDICWDATHIYVCTATNTWKRAAIAAW